MIVKLLSLDFFPLYGEGLNKQLIWDTLQKIKKKIIRFVEREMKKDRGCMSKMQ